MKSLVPMLKFWVPVAGIMRTIMLSTRMGGKNVMVWRLTTVGGLSLSALANDWVWDKNLGSDFSLSAFIRTGILKGLELAEGPRAPLPTRNEGLAVQVFCVDADNNDEELSFG